MSIVVNRFQYAKAACPAWTTSRAETGEPIQLASEGRRAPVNPADVEDVFQKTSIVMWKKMSTFDPDGSFFHWACGFALNEVRNFLTVQRRSRLQFDLELVELLVETVDSARLLAGTVFIDVTEVSYGFLLETPEAQIMDEGTQYAVSMDSLATEVHVFDGREAAIKVSPLTVLVRSVLEWTLPIERPQALHQHSPRGWTRSLTMESVFWLTVAVVSGAKHSSLAAFVADQAKSEPTISAL